MSGEPATKEVIRRQDVNYSYCMIEDFGVRDSPAIFGIPVEAYINTEFIKQLV
ncbi:hypothetical protein GH733_002446, partial [Mirounga leonina]